MIKSKLTILFLILVAAALISAGYNLNKKIEDNNAQKAAQEEEEFLKEEQNKPRPDFSPSEDKDITILPANYPVSLSYKTKKEVYDIRKRYVKESLFANQDYEPSEDVFGLIIDNLPWYSLDKCYLENKPSIVTGPSRVARSIVNPSIPVIIDLPFGYPVKDFNEYSICREEDSYLLPVAARYNKSKNEVELTMNSLPHNTTNNAFYQLEGINARDFGYKYVYLDKNKTTLKISFVEDNNMSTEPVEFKDFIHRGSSCGVEGGCNNISPFQQKLGFKVLNPDENKYPAEIYLKLWKNKPNSAEEDADIYEKIIILKKLP